MKGAAASTFPATYPPTAGFTAICTSASSPVMSPASSIPSPRIIYGGVDTQLFSPDPQVAREPLVVFVGRLMPHKGVNDLVAALPSGLRLELIGRPYHERFYEDLQRLAVGKDVHFRTDCDDAEIVRAYRRALVVVLPSVYRTCYGEETRVPELLGQTLIEGMACNTPAMCTRVASMPEVVVDGETGFVVPANDPAAMREKLEYLRDNPQRAAEMGIAGRRRVLEHFSWPITVDRCLQAYRELGFQAPTQQVACGS